MKNLLARNCKVEIWPCMYFADLALDTSFGKQDVMGHVMLRSCIAQLWAFLAFLKNKNYFSSLKNI